MKRKRMKQSPLFREPENQKRDAVFTLRVEPALLARIKAAAEHADVSANAWLRLATLHALTFDVVRTGKR